MSIKIKNWKLTILSLIFIGIFTALGLWQLTRAEQKKAIVASYQHRAQLPPFEAKDLKTPKDWRFYKVKLKGEFDNKHTFLLDNTIHNGKVGYEVYTPFKASGINDPILVDRGFIPTTTNRDELPPVPKATDKSIVIEGMLNLPPRYVAYGNMVEMNDNKWPMRVEFINLPEISKIINNTVYPYVLNIDPESPSALQVKWQIVTVDPNKHMAYAVQWFALALTLLIISVVLNRTPKRKRVRDK